MSSMDEIIEQYWLMLDVGNEGETKMNWNDLELDFQRFLKETDEGTNTVKLCSSPLISPTVVDNNLKINNIIQRKRIIRLFSRPNLILNVPPLL